MRILYLTNSFPLPDQPGGSRAWRVVKWLVDQGHDVTVLGNRHSHLTGEPVPAGSTERPVIYEGVKLVGFSGLKDWRRSLLRRALAYLVMGCRAYRLGRRLPEVDVVVAGTPPLLMPVTGLLLARLHRAAAVLEVRDLYPHTAIALGKISEGWASRLWGKGEAWIRRRYDHIVAVTPGMRPMLIDEGQEPGRITVITNAVDTSKPRGERPSKEIEAFFATNAGRFVFGYAGGMGLFWNVPCLIDAALELSERDDVAFFFVGAGEQFEPCRRRVEKSAAANIGFFPAIARRQANWAIERCDAMLMAHPKGTFHEYGLPNKIFDYMAFGKPVIAACGGSIAAVINDAAGGLAVPADDAAAVAAAMRCLADDPGEAEEMGRRAKAYIFEHYAQDSVFRRWHDVLAHVAPAPQSPQKQARQAST